MTLNSLKLPFVLAVGLTVGAVAHQAFAGQGHMTAALESLKSARNQLENATADKGGHRAKAIKLVDDAIEETKAGIEFDKQH